NDIVNPSALDEPDSPIAGMPVLECWKGKTTIVLKRSMATGYAGVENPLFFKENTRMLFGDARESLESVLKALVS
ncbi:MAG: NAD(P)(+) transhydrogenase (Re/Si-specific) subunit beta, partial [Roseibacillus sp.]|nr:NAD(P)(+) transhydrogenase (Re/Si-specific) subunit beta [Roseibacillus sp.]